MKKRIGFGTLDSRIYISFTLLIFFAVFTMQLVSSRFTVNTVRNSVLENNRVLLIQLTAQIDSYIKSLRKLSRTIQNDKQIQYYLSADKGAGLETDTVMKHSLQNYIQARDDISDILVVGFNGTVITGDPGAVLNRSTSIKRKEWFIKAMEGKGKTYISSSYVQDIIAGRYPWVVSMSRELFSVQDGKPLGVLLIDLKFNRINDLCRSLVVGRKGYNFIIDGQMNYVFHPTQQLVYSNLRSEPVKPILDLLQQSKENIYHEGTRYYMIETSETTGWYVVSVTHMSDILPDWNHIQVSYTIIGLIFFLVVGFAANRISSSITKPVRKLRDIMKSVDTGEFKIAGSMEASDEIKELAREYDIMVGRIRELIAENIREQELKRKSDLKALQAQINPHFLYNTLDSIIWMGEMGQSKEVVHMTSSLAKLFRLSISGGREIIPLKDEIAHVESYLTIQKMRYRDKFTYSIEIDPALYRCPMLKITLQPLVENAIYHGIKEVDHSGIISIRGEKNGDSILLSVQDNGRGMDEAALEALARSVYSSNSDDASMLTRPGMGVRNVHERIRLYFGEEYGLSFFSSTDKGTTVTVKIPFTDQEV